MIVTPLVNALGVRDYRARGFAVGIASHGIGTARAFQVDPVAGRFAGIAIGLKVAMAALVVPWLVGVIRQRGLLARDGGQPPPSIGSRTDGEPMNDPRVFVQR